MSKKKIEKIEFTGDWRGLVFVNDKEITAEIINKINEIIERLNE